MCADVAAGVDGVAHAGEHDSGAADLDEPRLSGHELVERGDPDGLSQC